MNIVIMGPPGAGKGTQAKLLSERFGIPHLSTGVMLRDEIQRMTEIGRLAKSLIDHGEFVPDDVITTMVFDRLGTVECEEGYILDGFPRTTVQADSLVARLTGTRPLDLVIALDVTVSDILRRIEGRAGENRPDDAPDVIGTRLEIYRDRTKPVETVLSRVFPLHRVDGGGGIAEVFETVAAVVQGCEGLQSGHP